ncbi:MAG: bifunctional anthranilate synthase component I family protein/class IV aminotransferase [Magnetococcales bacterium]|nr:bifunctional anthranilate synthase component I family protein/class IV aminotransferase [Magnetococcales bacterium]
MARTQLTPQLITEQICQLVDFPGQDSPKLLSQPKKILTTSNPHEVPELLRKASQLAKAGGWVGGYLCYEAAGAFSLPVVNNSSKPLMWFAQFDQVQDVCYPHPNQLESINKCIPYPQTTQAKYGCDLTKILAYIQAGDSYQVNHTVSAKLTDNINLANLYLSLQPQHRFDYASWLNCGNMTVASFSPELLLAKEGNKITTAPIKGTRPRSLDFINDLLAAKMLQKSAKDRAEHVMIVDMARNDLGRVCKVGSVEVPHLFELRHFSTLFHLESRVSGELLPDIELNTVMAAMFPAASITGAPKRRTMEIIKELEQRKRGVYTGSIGVIKPGGDYTFNVAIRSVTQSKLNGPAYMGLGGGIVADSNPKEEWAEIADKGAFLNNIPEHFSLIETFLLNNNCEINNLADHLQRLEISAHRLGFRCNKAKIKRDILATAKILQKNQKLPLIMRLELAIDGEIIISSRAFIPPPSSLRVLLADNRVDRHNNLLRHKTTRRLHFDYPLKKAKDAGFDEVLFLNNIGRVTEGAIRAIFIRIGSKWYTPPITDGLLPSIWRKNEITRLGAKERSLTLEDITQACELKMGNSVQGGVAVSEIVTTTQLEKTSYTKVWGLEP